MDIPDEVYAAAKLALHERQCDCPEGPGHDPLAEDDARAIVEAVVSVLMASDVTYALGYAHALERLRGAAMVLITHSRTSIEGCHCGWAKLGHSHAQHVADMLADHLAALAPRPPSDEIPLTLPQPPRSHYG